MLPPVAASSSQPVGPGSSDSYSIVNRPSLFPLGVSAVSSQDPPVSVASTTIDNDVYSLVAGRPDLFLQAECNRLTVQMDDLYQRRASIVRAITALTGLPVPSPAYLRDPPPESQ